jgi:hypothetical protein
MDWNIWAGDVRAWAARYDGPPFHALLCDPPYHLTSITKRFGGDGSVPAKFGKDGAFQRSSAGFMGQQWDGGDLAFRPETWAAFMPHLHPGAFGMAFAGSRGWHRLAVAIEDAGYIIHPMIGWLFGSGFPKSTRIDTQIDRAAGAEDQRQPEREWTGGQRSAGIMGNNNGTQTRTITAPATPLAQAWASHRYGLQSLKPAIEPIICFQKPYAGRPCDSITATGAGAINVDAGRIDASEGRPALVGLAIGYGADGHSKAIGTTTQGRWPANLALSHAPGCTPMSGGDWDCEDGCPVKALGRQSGETCSTGGFPINKTSERHGWTASVGPTTGGLGDTGTAARFFHNSSYLLDRLEDADPFLYTAKAASWEREAGLADADLTTVSDGRAKSIDNPYQRGETKRRNQHPTIKPITLTRWLAALLLPPAEYAPRRLLVPFSGAGSEMAGAGLAGWDVVQGIEQSSEYAATAWARLEWWARYHGWDAEAAMEAAAARFAAQGNVPEGQLALL